MRALSTLKTRKSLIILFLFVILELFFFRHLFICDTLIGNTLIGNSGDSLLNNLIVEHWYRFYCGLMPINDLPIFYPVHNTLAYTDMLLAFSFPYSFLRFLGMNMFLANELTLILFHFFGVLSFFYFLYNKMKFHFSACFIGVVLAFYSSAFYNKIGHTQFFALGLLPLLFIFLTDLQKKYALEQRVCIKSAVSFSLLLALILYTSWYVGYFLCLFSLIYILVFLMQSRGNILKFIGLLRLNFKTVFSTILFEGMLLIPFIMAYLPVKNLNGSWDWQNITLMLPRWFDFINVSGNNLFLGKVFGSPFFYNRELCHELYLGFSWAAFLLLVMVSVYYTRRRLNNCLMTTLCLTVWVSFLLLIKVHGFSLWYLVYKFIPGGSAIRAASRYMFFLSFPVAFIIARYWQDYLKDWLIKRYRFAGLVIVPVFLFMENINCLGYDKTYNVSSLQAFINNVPKPLNDLPIYIVDSTSVSHTLATTYQLDAWLIADKYNLKTINGYSGKFPLEWEFFEVKGNHYEENVQRWLVLNDISAIQGYDIGTNSWFIRDNRIKNNIFLKGWYGPEPWGRWSSSLESSVIIPKDTAGKNSIMLDLQSFHIPRQVTVKVNNEDLARFWVFTERATVNLPLPESDSNENRVKVIFKVDEGLESPQELGLSNDSRKLGIGISKINLTSGGGN